MNNKILPIQELRAIAILYVVLFHAGNIFHYPLFSQGWSGFSIFFVISGFVISYTQKKRAGISGFVYFAKKRITRIYLPYILPFFVMLFLFLVTGKGNEHYRDILNITRNLLLIQAPSLTIHPYAWFLVYQVYYYLTFGILVIGFQLNVFAYSLMMVIPYFAVLTFGWIAITKDTVPFAPESLFFISGVLLGVVYDRLNIHFRYPYAIFALFVFLIVPHSIHNFYLFLICTVALVFIYSKTSLPTAWLSTIGDSSYSIYLIHAIVLAVLKTIIADRSVFTFLLFLVCCLVAGTLYYRYFEKNILRIADRILGIEKEGHRKPADQLAASN